MIGFGGQLYRHPTNLLSFICIILKNQIHIINLKSLFCQRAVGRYGEPELALWAVASFVDFVELANNARFLIFGYFFIKKKVRKISSTYQS
jgi:hypothetical protein